MRSSYYEIRIVGTVPPEALVDFEKLTASLEPVETVLQGRFRIRPPCRASWQDSRSSAPVW